VCTVSGVTVTLLTDGTCSITASQAGNSTYAAAASVTQTFAVTGKAQTITFGTLSGQTLGAAPFALSATATSGLTVAFASNSAAVCTVSGVTVTLLTDGTCSITASQAGNSTYAAAASVTQTFAVAGKAQTITFGTLSGKTLGTAPFALSATATSGLTVTFTSNNTAVCTVSGVTVTLVNTGTCSITASQAGNSTYAAAAPVTQTFTVGGTAQTITFGPLSGKTLGTAPFALSATATSGLTVTFASNNTAVCTVSGVTVTLLTSGTCSITASQAGNSTYAAATTVTQTFTVSLIAQTITFGPLGSQALNGSTPPALNATATSGLAVTFTSNSPAVCTVFEVYITLLSAGTCSITANQAGNATYAAALPVTQTFTVSLTGFEPVAAFLDQNGAPALTFNLSMNFPDAGGFLLNPPGVAQDAKGNTYVVGLDSAGGVHLNSYSYASSTWNGWQYSGGILDTSSGLTAAVAPNGVVWFTGRDIGNRFWINSWNGTGFGGWILVANGIFASDSVPQIAIPSDGTIYVVGKDIGGRVWSNSYNPANQTFTGWIDRQGLMIGQPSATAGQDGLVYVAVRSVSTNSPVYIKQVPAQNAATATSWLNGGGQVDTDPQITSQGGTVSLLALAGGDTVYLLTFAESTQTFGPWTLTNGTLSDATIAAAGGYVYIAGRDSADRIYWYSVTGNSWFLAGGTGISSTVLAGGK
jgi:hypothetical protein